MPPFFFCFLSFLFVFSFSYCSVKSPAPQTRKNGQDKRPGEKGSKEIKQREETGVSEGKEGCRKEDNDAKSTRKERGKDEWNLERMDRRIRAALVEMCWPVGISAWRNGSIYMVSTDFSQGEKRAIEEKRWLCEEKNVPLHRESGRALWQEAK